MDLGSATRKGSIKLTSKRKHQGGRPIFSTGNDATWPMIIEKAYAKLHGSYANLEGGSVANALQDLTGQVCSKEVFAMQIENS